MSIGDRLEKLRKERKLSQNDMAKFLGITRQGYGNYESGARRPDNETLQKLADFFEVSTDYLLGRTDDPKRPDSNNEIKNPRILRMISRANELSHLSEDELNQALDYIDFLFQVAEKRRKNKEQK
jgi:Predicted transcriptional regulators